MPVFRSSKIKKLSSDWKQLSSELLCSREGNARTNRGGRDVTSGDACRDHTHCEGTSLETQSTIGGLQSARQKGAKRTSTARRPSALALAISNCCDDPTNSRPQLGNPPAVGPVLLGGGLRLLCQRRHIGRALSTRRTPHAFKFAGTTNLLALGPVC